MLTKKSIKKTIADTVLLELDPAFGILKLGWGEQFHLHQRQLYFNKTPLADPTFSAVETLLITDHRLEFSAGNLGKTTHFAVEEFFPGTHVLARLLETLYRGNLEVADNFKDNVHILLDDDGLTLRLVNTEENKRIILTTSRRHGNFFVQRFPEPSRRFAFLSCHVAANSSTLEISCDGKDLYNSTADESMFNYTWNLDIQPAFSEVVTSMIRAGIQYGFGQAS